MAQLTIRVPDALAEDVKAAARSAHRSVNAWVAGVLTAAVDPEFESDEADRLRAKLRRAGLLVEPPAPDGEVPTATALARARRAAGQGRPLSEHVIEGRR